jgi:RNA polymerase sigma factor (sigma-70 family)
MSKEKRKEKGWNSKNFILKSQILELSSTIKNFCYKYGFSTAVVRNLINLKMSPIRTTKKQEYRVPCKKLAEILGFSCENLFPMDLYGIQSPFGEIEEIPFSQFYGDEDEPISFPSEGGDSFDLMVKKVMSEMLTKILKKLDPNCRKVIELIIWEDKTRNEVAMELGIEKSRVRFFQAKALASLRTPFLSKDLQEFASCD